MAWFRTNKDVATWLALFALACQLTFSFGHVHIGKFGSGFFTNTAAQTTAGKAADGPTSSPEKSPADLSVDFCAVCANISLAGSLILPILALILAPGLSTPVLRWPLAARPPASSDYRPFGARGPPPRS